MNKDDIKEVIVVKNNDSYIKFLPNQKDDRASDGTGDHMPMREAPETIKVEAQELRDRIKKAGLL